ncbi:putative zinc metalloprotease TRE2 [Lachancea thermotolerans]
MVSSSNRYRPVGQDDIGDSPESNDSSASLAAEELPPNPPGYVEEMREGQEPQFEIMDFDEDPLASTQSRVARLRQNFKNCVVTPVRNRIADPLAVLMSMASHKVDYYLSKIGNPLILRRFVYVFFASLFIYYVSSSGLLPSERTTGTRGMFSDKTQLMSYAKRALDLSKMENDLEYISSMPHMAGTKGDFAVSQYIREAFANNGLRVAGDAAFKTYLNYPGNVSLTAYAKSGGKLSLELSEQNFNPLSVKGEVREANLLYAHYGSGEDYRKLKEENLIDDNTVAMIHYSKNAGEQVVEAQEAGIKAILFISDGYGEDQIDSIQQKSVQNFRYDMGDPLSPGWTSSLRNRIELSESLMVPKIPTIPLSRRQAEQLRKEMTKEGGIKFEDGWYSGTANDLKIDFSLDPVVRQEHFSWSIAGRIEGREQSDKAIIISSARDSACTGCTYPNYGTAALLSLAQLFQQVKYKYGWKPLRTIYFISYDASQFGHAGATELLESELIKIKNEVYTVLDISQLGVTSDSLNLDIQAHPLLFDFLKDEDLKTGVDTEIRTVQQFGDWSAFLAHGIPVAAISAPHVLERKYPIESCDDTFERLKQSINEDYWEKSSEVLLYVFKMALKLADEPMIPLGIAQYSETLQQLLQDLQESAEGLDVDFEQLGEGITAWKRIDEQSTNWVHAWNNIVMVENEGIEPSFVAVDRWNWNKKLTHIGIRHCALQGLPHRPFYKNVLFGPTLKDQSPHSSWSFPGIKDAIFDRDATRAQDQANLAAEILLKSAESFIEYAGST